MGLFGKKKEKEPVKSEIKEPERRGFRGDLAGASERKTTTPSTSYEDIDSEIKNWEVVRDDPNSTIFITFEEKRTRSTWLCPDCGTINLHNREYCVVCGWKMNRRK